MPSSPSTTPSGLGFSSSSSSFDPYRGESSPSLSPLPIISASNNFTSPALITNRVLSARDASYSEPTNNKTHNRTLSEYHPNNNSKKASKIRRQLFNNNSPVPPPDWTIKNIFASTIATLLGLVAGTAAGLTSAAVVWVLWSPLMSEKNQIGSKKVAQNIMSTIFSIITVGAGVYHFCKYGFNVRKGIRDYMIK